MTPASSYQTKLHHLKIECEEDIPDLCKNIFLTKEKFLSIIWIVASFMLLSAGGCIAWAMTTNTSIVNLQRTQEEEKNKVEYLQKQVNEKLDILIKRSEK